MESVRPHLIAILNRVAASGGEQIVFADNATLDEIQLVAQLIDDRYLTGDYVCDEDERPCNAVVTGITLTGRRYVEQLEEEHRGATPKGKIKKWAKYGLAYIGGVLTPVLTQALLKWLRLE
jgi:hypothetical protein